MAKAGRPKIQIDYALLERLCTIQCTDSEIAACLKISRETVDDRKNNDPVFSDIYKSARENGKMSLRRKMYAQAMAGNVTMMIWLSKQILGYTDNNERNNGSNPSDRDPKEQRAIAEAMDALTKDTAGTY